MCTFESPLDEVAVSGESLDHGEPPASTRRKRITLASLALRIPCARQVVRFLGTARTRGIVADAQSLLEPARRLVDIGSGTCDIAAALQEHGHQIVPCDIRDLSCVPGLRPMLVDGIRLPFRDDAFDVALLISVLHHIAGPDAALREAARVAPKVIVIEEIYRSQAQRFVTYAADSLVNLEFFGHPHSNRDDAGWSRTFDRLSLELRKARYRSFGGFFASAAYLVERRGAGNDRAKR